MLPNDNDLLKKLKKHQDGMKNLQTCNDSNEDLRSEDTKTILQKIMDRTKPFSW